MRLVNRLILVGLALIATLISSAQYVQPMRYDHYAITQQASVGAGVVRVTDPSAYLEIGPTSGGNKGLLPPRLSTTQRNAIPSPSAGLMIFNTTTGQYNYYNGTSWTTFSSGVGGSGISQLGTGLWLVLLNDSTYAVDTATANTFYRSLFVQTGGSYANPSWIASLSWSKITGTPTTLGGYGITNGVDTIRRVGLDWQMRRNGTWTNVGTDSLGGGGSQTLDQTLALGDSSGRKMVLNDSSKTLFGYNKSYMQVGEASRSNKIWMVYGTSISSTATPTIVTAAQSYVTLLSRSLGFQVQNRSKVAGTVIQYSAGDSSLENKIYTIPVFNSGYGLLTIEGPGINDGYTPLGKPFDTTAAKAALNKFIDTAQARLWPNDSLVIISSPYTTSSQYPNIVSYNRAARTVAEQQGIRYVDMYTFTQERGGMACLGDSIHPNAYGHSLYEVNFLKTVTNLKKVGILTVNGPASIIDSAYIRDSLRIGNIVPNFGTNGLSVKNDILTDGRIKAGQGLADIDNAKIQARTSAFQVGVVAYNGSNNWNRMYAEYSEVRDASSYIRTNPNQFTYNNGITFVGSGTNTNILSLGTYGGIVLNDAGIDSDVRIEGDNEVNLFFTDASADKIGVKTATPDSTVTVNGSVHVIGNFRNSGAPLSSDTSTYKPYGISPTGVTVRMSSWPGGSGGGMTNPMTTTGDIIYSSSGSTPARLGIGTEGQVLLSNGTTPYWGPVPGGSASIYVDSMYNNGSADSLIWKKNGNRYAIPYPAAGSFWGLNGNNMTGGWTEGNFLGLTNNRQLLIKTNNILRARIDSAGSAGTFRLYPGTNTSAYIDYGLYAANKWTIAAGGVIINTTSDMYIASNGVNTAAFYNGGVTAGSASGASGTILQVDNASTTKSAMRWTSTTKKTTAADGDWTRDANGVYYGKSTTWNEILMTASVNSVSPTAPDRTITVVIGGTTYYIHAKTTND